MVAKKEVSVGEFDARTGVTHVTLQRGRLMFNMGPPSTKRAAAAAALAALVAREDRAAPETSSGDDTMEETSAGQRPLPQPQPPRVFRSGVDTGRSLFAEETVYLVQRGALVVYALEVVVDAGGAEITTATATATPKIDERAPLALARLVALVVRHGFASRAALDVYAFLKDNKLHPRRSTPSPNASASSLGLFLFDVSKTVTETQYVAVEPTSATTTSTTTSTTTPEALHEPMVPDAAPPKMRKRKVKSLALIFRVAVSAFHDSPPRPRELRKLLSELAMRRREHEQGQADRTDDGDDDGEDRGDASVPLKLAVVDADRSVLLFEVA